MTQYISVKTYASLGNLSERSVRRYVAMNVIDYISDAVKNRTLIALSEVLKNCPITLSNDDISLIIQADAGDANAQNDLALLFLAGSEPSIAIYWLTLSAKQNHSDAMQLLGACYATGTGLGQDKNKAMTWISKAATLGSVLALKQMDAMLFS